MKYKCHEQCMVAYAAQRPTRKASAGQHSVHASVGTNKKIKHTPKFTLATTEGYKDKNGQVYSQTEWQNIVLWRGLAELAEQYLKQGSMIHVEGKTRTRSYEDKQGVKRYVTEVVGRKLSCSIKKRGEGSAHFVLFLE